jgi:hypothetical protein
MITNYESGWIRVMVFWRIKANTKSKAEDSTGMFWLRPIWVSRFFSGSRSAAADSSLTAEDIIYNL